VSHGELWWARRAPQAQHSAAVNSWQLGDDSTPVFNQPTHGRYRRPRDYFLYRFDSAQPVDGGHVDGEIFILTKSLFTEMGLWIANG